MVCTQVAKVGYLRPCWWQKATPDWPLSSKASSKASRCCAGTSTRPLVSERIRPSPCSGLMIKVIHIRLSPLSSSWQPVLRGALTQIRLRCLQQHMEMIPHQHPGMHRPAKAAIRLFHQIRPREAVLVILENILPAITWQTAPTASYHKGPAICHPYPSRKSPSMSVIWD